MKKTIAVLLILPLLLFVTVLALDRVSQSRAQKEHVWLMETLLPGGTDFCRVEYTGEDTAIRSVHQSSAGFVIETATHGYADEIVMLVGVNNEGVVTGVVTLEAHETVGLGSKILTDTDFLSQFLNKTGSFAIGAAGADAFSSATDAGSSGGNEITVDGISGATVSSKAVARCVNAAVAYVTGADIGSSATEWGG